MRVNLKANSCYLLGCINCLAQWPPGGCAVARPRPHLCPAPVAAPRRRNAKAKSELGELESYLSRVNTVMGRFEERLFGVLRGFIALAVDRPTLLVDCVRVIELQEALDAQYGRVRMGYKPKAYKERFFRDLVRATDARFEALQDYARTCGTHNKKVGRGGVCARVLRLELCEAAGPIALLSMTLCKHSFLGPQIKYDQDGDPVIAEERDAKGGLSRVVIQKGVEAVDIRDKDALKKVKVIEEVRKGAWH